MFENWLPERIIAFRIYATYAIITFMVGTVSALVYWESVFGNWIVPVILVAFIEGLSLVAFLSVLNRIPINFAWVRHGLPLVSIAPIGIEIYSMANNYAITGLVVFVLVFIGYQAYHGMEKLTIDRATAEEERANRQATELKVQSDMHRRTDEILTETSKNYLEGKGVLANTAEQDAMREQLARLQVEQNQIRTDQVRGFEQISDVLIKLGGKIEEIAAAQAAPQPVPIPLRRLPATTGVSMELSGYATEMAPYAYPGRVRTLKLAGLSDSDVRAVIYEEHEMAGLSVKANTLSMALTRVNKETV